MEYIFLCAFAPLREACFNHVSNIDRSGSRRNGAAATAARGPVRGRNLRRDRRFDETEVDAGVVRSRTVGMSRPGADSDRKSTRLNSSHSQISYAVFCLKKKIIQRLRQRSP